MSALIGLCLIIGGLLFDLAEAAFTEVATSTIATLNTSIGTDTDIVALPTFHVKDGTPYVPGPPPGDGLNLYPGGPYGPAMSLAGRLASPSLLWICTIVMCVCLVRVAACLQGDSLCSCDDPVETSDIADADHIVSTAIASANTASGNHREVLKAYRGSDGTFTVQQNKGKRTEAPTPQEEQISKTFADEVDISTTAATSASRSPEDESNVMTIYRPNAGRLMVERKKTKRAELPAQQEKNISETYGQENSPGSLKVALLLTMLLFTAMMVPMAFAEPTSTSMPSWTLSLPVPSPCSAVLDTTGTVFHPSHTSFDLDKKDKPQSWIYSNPGTQRRAHTLWLLVPLLLMGNFLLPTLATLAIARWLRSEPPMGAIVSERQSSALSTTGLSPKAHTAADLQKRTAQGEPDPIWVTSYTTTTTYLPTVTVTESPDPALEPAAYATGAAGDFWQPAPVGIEGICTERNLAVCPIVLGRKGWEPSISAASGKMTTRMALLAVIAGLAAVAVAVAETDYLVYLPVETSKAISPAIEPRIAVDDELTHVIVDTSARHPSAEQNTHSVAVPREQGKELMVRDSDIGTSTCRESSSSSTTASTSTTKSIIAAGRHWAVNGSAESGADTGYGFSAVAAGSFAFAAGIAFGSCPLNRYWYCV